MSDFFAARPDGEPGLAVFLNAGDPSLDMLPELVAMLDESRVDCLELAVPFPHSFTDGPVVRRSARRALANGVGFADVLACLDRLATPRHLRIALLADWSHTVRPLGMDCFLARVRDSAADGLLTHGLPARARVGYYQAAHQAGIPVVSTCYPSSDPATRVESARNATAYLYLVAHYGRSGTPSADGFRLVRPALRELRADTSAPIAVGFGVRGRAEIEALRDVGADAAIVGSAAVARVERAAAECRDVVADLARFVADLRSETTATKGVARQ
ncbi:tryptophan synthase subunit alpha [Actinocrispum wychmicini]|uniref:tryptophan synthase n=1 Tax=Actinocrispum wychmicini TaxID=1213861 RepID=A0A4R2JP97_9PSEU|nr:tryptophan synthase subunit alpha [Actinocrispum wychmicini]TCO60582.1 tryptophan synthase alpha chain [Actinocrispum wychmicini]